ncbi:hypothetical protein [Virgibacillus halodenitrificans]|jgi:hypothetical protein|uniref:hypothetical protein n=1 Tax=Virgibacillus halodenitrificans TaxID=1482 RepID=UPI001F251794|nr:hypothetical protein [Virgibacillus halodenitrificans]
MDVISDFFEAIASNFFIIALIIGGIISFMKDNTSKGKKQEPFNRPESSPQKQPYSQPTVQNEQLETQSQAEEIGNTLAEQQRKRMEELAEREQVYSARSKDEINRHDAILGNTSEQPSEVALSHKQRKFKKQVTANFEKKGLANGIIMSEILGPPRAVKPYKSVVQQRRK